MSTVQMSSQMKAILKWFLLLQSNWYQDWLSQSISYPSGEIWLLECSKMQTVPAVTSPSPDLSDHKYECRLSAVSRSFPCVEAPLMPQIKTPNPTNASVELLTILTSYYTILTSYYTVWHYYHYYVWSLSSGLTRDAVLLGVFILTIICKITWLSGDGRGEPGSLADDGQDQGGGSERLAVHCVSETTPG